MGTLNALVLHNCTKRSVVTVVDFKMSLVKIFLGDQMMSILEVVVDHMSLQTEGRFRCAYCSLFNRMKQACI